MTSPRNIPCNGVQTYPILRAFVDGVASTTSLKFSSVLLNPFQAQHWTGLFFTPTKQPREVAQNTASGWQTEKAGANVSARGCLILERECGADYPADSLEYRNSVNGSSGPSEAKRLTGITEQRHDNPWGLLCLARSLPLSIRFRGQEKKIRVQKYRYKRVNKSEYREYLKSDHWRELRGRKLAIKPACEICGETRWIQVHHLRYRKIYNVRVTDLQTLCEPCHCAIHGIKSQNSDAQSVTNTKLKSIRPKRKKKKKVKIFTTHEHRAEAAKVKVRAILSSPPKSTAKTPIPHHQQKQLDKKAVKWIFHVNHLKSVLEKHKQKVRNAPEGKQLELAEKVTSVEDAIALLERKIARFSTPPDSTGWRTI